MPKDVYVLIILMITVSIRYTIRGDKKYPTIMLEAVVSQDLWIWHAFYGMAGANNDINVLDNSPLFDDLLDDLAPVVSYVVNGVEYRNGYYLADGIYPEWASFVKIIHGLQ
ncbi:ALP1-like protein [Tanacetum coccineum]